MATKKQAPKTDPKPETPATDDMMTPTDTSDSEKSPMLQLSGLWVNESKSGKKYMTGYMGNLKIMIFRNEYKSKDNEPDYQMYLAEKPRPDDAEKKANQAKDDIPF